MPLPRKTATVIVIVMSYVESGTQKLPNLIPEIENGQIKIPQFQRDFVWSVNQSAADTRLAQDKRAISEILSKRQPRLDWAIPIDEDRLINQRFSASSAFSKTILALLAGLGPRKYNSGDQVNLQNDNMHRANSLNFHHVFPRAYLKKQGYDEWEANRLVNISLVDDFKNKVLIRARPPSDYMTEFWEDLEGEGDFEEIMKTHLEGLDP